MFQVYGTAFNIAYQLWQLEALLGGNAGGRVLVIEWAERRVCGRAGGNVCFRLFLVGLEQACKQCIQAETLFSRP